ncbi:aspartate aminotransferase family protein [Aestuariivirga sp. YIM B02566]|uniref:Aminotransferase class III-fold pyridoxal phosphate-dependent enzyme n=1 Tax=Taklimakanibacter albus TaxID=2800327 RepID=A0ACC5RBN8_9HYPH|nr:aminotransferase class III-fold pyridoxal phosphate-dependent enzyme [Aestuariivirga sp. YIM B02566]MBK1869901.1 aminotransferase class III-fold pyridoxal phosphate-dependent enzyme [Aestuariivirga sp. YIM B02566]
MTANDLYARDEAAIGNLQKLRFFPSALTGGAGTRVIDQSGRSLLDLSAAWGAAGLGYGHPALVEAVARAVANPAGASVLSSANLPAVELAESLLATVPEIEGAKVWLGHSGSDANEAMFRAVTAATGRSRILAFAGAYHGGTAASMAISGHSVQTHAARHAGLTLIPYPAESRPFMGDATGGRVLELVEHLLKTTCPGEQVAALFIEPIQSDGGMIVPPPGFLKELTALCRRYGILIVSDEVKVGLARTGKLHAYAHDDFVPDIVCFGKGLGGGLPLAAAVAPARILDFASSFAMQTLHGNPVSAAAGLAVLDTIKRDRLADNAATVGSYFLDGLERLHQHHRTIREVRGRGLAIGIELDPDRTRRYAAKTVYRAFELGLVLYYVGLESNVLELTPPLVLTKPDVDEALQILDRSLADVEAGVVSDQTIAPFTGW